MNSSKIVIFLFFLYPVMLLPHVAFGQLDNRYFKADQLLNQQKYEEAAKQFEQLYNERPDQFLFLNKLTESLINLKKYRKAITITETAVQKGLMGPQAMIRLGELQHISGNEKQALQTWNKALENYSNDHQIYLRIARILEERKVFNKAIEVYKKLKSQSGDSNLLTSELGETYLQAGQYENAIKEFLNLLRNNPERITYVQRRLMRFRDNDIYDVAILEINDFLDSLSPNHPSYQNLRQLEVWLLMERKLFSRALVTAKNFEAQTNSLTYSLYNLGSKLIAEQQFKLAEQAYSYYIDNNIISLKNRSKEELADVYIKWANYLKNNNIGALTKYRSLYQKAFSVLNDLRNNAPSYHRSDQVLLTLSELALDVLHEPEKVSQYLAELQRLSEDSLSMAHKLYIEGRLQLYNENYTHARILFSKSNKLERLGNLAEKNRYYLALTDFFSGDYEFAKIQLTALERQNTSYFANDAVQLRLWIQEGLTADSSGQKLKPFAEIVEYISQGKDNHAINLIDELFIKDRNNPLLGHALLHINTSKNIQHLIFTYKAITVYLQQQANATPLREQLLWQKAKLADQIVTNKQIALPPNYEANGPQNQFFETTDIVIPKEVKQLIPLYEKILMDFPTGFYANYARNRIQELEEIKV